MIGFIKNLFAGIMNFFTGLFGGKKSGYYMELDEAAAAAQDTAKQAASNVKKAAESAASNTKKAVESVVSSTEKEVESAAAKDKNAAKPVAASATETKNGKKSAAAEPAKVELVQTANGVKAQPAKKSKADAAKVIEQQPTETTFAPKYLAVPSTSNGRRRPGANMNTFLDMARQVKNPSPNK